ncbi:MAG: PhoH family protein, partial [Candidatus Caldatribacteriota bacterium]|nr:PhoH family protein [Candidatus Caldatribacteriota bacterium]
MSENKQPVDWKLLYKDVIRVFKKDKEIRPKTLGQQKYIEAVRKNDIVFAIGPAGTGKTYLAVAIALSALKNKEVDRIILVRPAVEAGESLGYLPGDLLEKIDPYFRPLYDAMYEMMPSEKFQKYMERGIIEIAPLAYMRGRTLNNSFIILDDAQNTTLGQMKMFLTRFGFGSKVIIN